MIGSAAICGEQAAVRGLLDRRSAPVVSCGTQYPLGLDAADSPTMQPPQNVTVDVDEEHHALVVSSGPMPRWLEFTLAGLVEVANLAPNWDTYGAPRVEFGAVAAALKVLSDIMTVSSPAPSVVPTVKGGVQLEWHRGGVDFEIDVRPDGSIGAFYADPSGRVTEFGPDIDFFVLERLVAALCSG